MKDQKKTMMKFRKYIALLLGVGLLLTLWQGCKNDPVLPDNPFDDIEYPEPDPPAPEPDPNSIVGIHKNILVPKCNNPGCHDGTFEPDFRTVQSAYSTLVYHDIVKQTQDSSYEYRVTPYDTGASLLIRRLLVEDAQLQRMPATGDYLTDAEMGNIITWINNGAPDLAGNIGTAPNDEPTFFYVALNQAFTQIDTARVDSVAYNPFIVENNTSVLLAWIIEDDKTAPQDMQVNQTKFSLDKDDFSNAQTLNASWVPFGGVWVTTVNTSLFTPGSTVYFRHYVNDGDHSFQQ